MTLDWKNQKQFIGIWIGLLIVKLWLSLYVPLFADEAYYWVWSKHLALSYFDHPPMIAWITALASSWAPVEFVRWPSVIVGHCAVLAWFLLLKNYVHAKYQNLLFLLLASNVVTGLGTLLLVPDTPLMLVWPLTLTVMLKALKENAWKWYLLLGALCGIGFCSKYHMALLLPCALLWLSFEKLWSKVDFKKLALTFFVFALFSLPVWIWNAQHDWVSFRFQLNHGLSQTVEKPHGLEWLIDYLGSQTALIFPTVLILAIIGSSKKRLNPDQHWLLYFGWLPIGFFLLSSLKGRVEPNWTCIALPCLITLSFQANKGFAWLKMTSSLWIVIALVAASELLYPWLPLDHKKMKTHEFHAVDDFLELPGKYKPFFASSYQEAAMLSYKTGIPVYKVRGTHRKDQFDILDESMPSTDEFYVLMGVWNKHPEWFINYDMKIIKDYDPQIETQLLRYTRKK